MTRNGPGMLRDGCCSVTEVPCDARAMPGTSEAPHRAPLGTTKRATAEQSTLDGADRQSWSESWIFIKFPKIVIFFEILKSSNQFIFDPTLPRACIRGGKRLSDTLGAFYSRPTRRSVPGRCVQYNGFHRN